MKTKAEILEGLGNFYGTENYFRVSGRLVLTDGAKYLCTEAECFWFADIVNSILCTKPKIRRESFLVAKFEKLGESSGIFRLEDGNYNLLYDQEIPYTDCPLDKIEVFVEASRDFHVMLLKSEH